MYSLDPIAANCYPGTTVLINKFGIHDDEKLFQAEIAITQVAAASWELSPQLDTFDFGHYKGIHKHLFDDLYDFAGQVRDVDISKKGTRFCPYGKIDDLAGRIFLQLRKEDFLRGLIKNEFVSEFVNLYVTTNYLHPFREGNGRVQRLFLSQLARYAGFKLDFADIDVDELMIVTIQSAHGVSDGLKRIFTKAIN
jgi:cell filamentation protein